MKQERFKIAKRQKGISLIALIVTIIVLLILAGVGITMTWGNGGIADKAKDTANSALISQEQEKLSTLVLNLASKQMVTGDEVSLDVLSQSLLNYTGTETDINNTDSWIQSVEYDTVSSTIIVISNNKNIFNIRLNADNGMPETSYAGQDDGSMAPEITKIEVSYDNDKEAATIHVEVSTEDDRGITKVELVGIEERQEEHLKQVTEEFTVTSNGEYTIVATGGNGKVSRKNVTVDGIEETGNIVIAATPTYPVNTQKEGPVKVTITYEAVDGYTNEYQIGSTSGNWTKVSGTTQTLSISENTIVYARYHNGEQGKNEQRYVVGNIDNIVPNSFELEVIPSINSITVSGSTTDEAGTGANSTTSGITGYYFTIDGGKTWVSNSDKTNGSYTFTNLKTNTKYVIQGKAVDKAGNERLTVAKEVSTTDLPGGD